MDDLVLAKLNLNVFESNFGVYPTPPLSPLSFHPHDSYFPESVRIIDRQHEALKLINGTNHLRKLRNPKSILDIGCGKGAWTVDIASEFTTADEVVGVDINPSLPQQYPSNCRFELSDITKGIRYPEGYFSFIHSRNMKSVIRSWPTYLTEIYRVTAQGGYIQLTESSSIQSATLPNDSALRVMERAIQKHALISHHNLNISSTLAESVRSAGFHSIEEKIVSVPIGSWSPDPSMTKIGVAMMDDFLEQGTQHGRNCMIQIGIPEDVVDMYIEKVRREIKDPKYQLSLNFTYVTAKKGSRSRSSSPRGSPPRKSRKSQSPPSSPQ